MANGGLITDAVSSQKWPGEAKVHVSLVNWVKGGSSPTFVLNGESVLGISPELREPSRSTGTVSMLSANADKAFIGVSPHGSGFVVDEDVALRLLERSDARFTKVVRPYITSDDIANDAGQQPSRWVIDFDEIPLK